MILVGQQAAEMKLAYLHQSIIAYTWKEYIQSLAQLINLFISGK